MSLLDAHDRFLAEAVDRLAADDRVAAVAVSGSRGRGEADEWSDVDLLVTAFDDESTEVLSHPHEAEAFGELILWVDCSFNAVPGGTMAFARYDSDAGLVMVDWHITPLSLASHTTGSKLLWTRPGVELKPFDGNLVELVSAGQRRTIPPYSRQQRAEWELCMTHIAAARPPRGQDGRDLHRHIGLAEDTGPDPSAQLDGLERHLDRLAPRVAPRAMDATRARLAAARAALRA